jgi:hypothetical protein
MSYRKDEPSGSIFPGVVIILAMAGLVAALVYISHPIPSVRVWVPAQPGQAPARGPAGNCSPVWTGCSAGEPA